MLQYWCLEKLHIGYRRKVLQPAYPCRHPVNFDCCFHCDGCIFFSTLMDLESWILGHFFFLFWPHTLKLFIHSLVSNHVEILNQWFSNCRMNQNHPKALLKHKFLDPTPEFLIQCLGCILITHVFNIFQGSAIAANQDHTLRTTI